MERICRTSAVRAGSQTKERAADRNLGGTDSEQRHNRSAVNLQIRVESESFSGKWRLFAVLFGAWRSPHGRGSTAGMWVPRLVTARRTFPHLGLIVRQPQPRREVDFPTVELKEIIVPVHVQCQRDGHTVQVPEPPFRNTSSVAGILLAGNEAKAAPFLRHPCRILSVCSDQRARCSIGLSASKAPTISRPRRLPVAAPSCDDPIAL